MLLQRNSLKDAMRSRKILASFLSIDQAAPRGLAADAAAAAAADTNDADAVAWRRRISCI